jgi:REP element-mobilizing transposase RayT
MPETYIKIYIHVVFAVYKRQPLISNQWSNQLFAYINGIIENNNHKLISINGMPDHVHLLISISPEQSISDLLRDIKTNSTLWINRNQRQDIKFTWQRGYSAFAVSFNDINRVRDYIENQQEHHRVKTYKEEVIHFLNENNISFDLQYLFK